MNNSVFGKTLENVRDRSKMKIIAKNDDKKKEKNLQKPTYAGHYDEVENAYILFMNEARVELNKPIAVGMSVLDISKTLMYDFHYNVMLPKYGIKNLRLCMTDTDSLLYWIATDDVYADTRSMKHHFDLSEYDKSHPNYDETNKKALGKFKDEESKNVITEVVGLRAKLYSYSTVSGKSKQRAKGVKKDVVKKMKLDHYMNVLSAGHEATPEMTMRKMVGIQSKKHTLRTLETNKIALSAFDDKRYLLDDGVFSVPYGYNGGEDAMYEIVEAWNN
jgi:hypothetical protein